MPNVEITSKAYVLGVTKEKLVQSLYKVFYNRIVNYVTRPNSSTNTKWWYPAWPDCDIDNSSSYPIGIINSPEIAWEKSTLRRRTALADIDIEVFVTKQKDLDDLTDQIMNAIETNANTFRDINLKFVTLESSDTTHVVRDKITVHSKSMRFTCKFTFTSSLG